MPKMTIKELDKKIAYMEEQRAENIKQQAAAAKEAQEYAEQAEIAAKAGDVDGYIKAKQAKENAEARQYVAEAQINKNDKVSRDDIMEAWADYRKGYDERHAKRMTELAKVRSAFVELFFAAVDEQNEALQVREKLGKLLGLPTTAPINGDSVYQVLPMPTIPAESGKLKNKINYNGIDYNGDAAFAAHAQQLDMFSDDLQRLNFVVKLRRAVQ